MTDMSGRCATCTYWGARTAWFAVAGARLQTCAAPAMMYGYGMHDDIPDDGVCIEDDEGWGFLTGPAFGCVHWMTKEERHV